MHKHEILSSPDNKKIKELQQLSKKKNRYAQQSYMIEGIRFIESALDKQVQLNDVFYSSDLKDNQRGMQIIQKVIAKNIRLHEVSSKLFCSISDTVNSQGILAIAPMPQIDVSDTNGLETAKLSIILDRIQDPGNLGTIIRTADAAGIRDVVLIKGTTDPFSTKVLRSTMGSIFDVRLHFMETEEVIHLMKENGIRLTVTSLEASNFHYELSVANPLSLVIGNEGNGVSKAFNEAADELIKIPMYGGAESLNASVAAGIVMYDCAIRQRNL